MPGSQDADAAQKWYFNLETGEVENGPVSDWTRRIGPYASEAEATQALEIARARNEKWEAEDARERAWADGDDDD